MLSFRNCCVFWNVFSFVELFCTMKSSFSKAALCKRWCVVKCLTAVLAVMQRFVKWSLSFLDFLIYFGKWVLPNAVVLYCVVLCCLMWCCVVHLRDTVVLYLQLSAKGWKYRMAIFSVFKHKTLQGNQPDLKVLRFQKPQDCIIKIKNSPMLLRRRPLVFCLHLMCGV